MKYKHFFSVRETKINSQKMKSNGNCSFDVCALSHRKVTFIVFTDLQLISSSLYDVDINDKHQWSKVQVVLATQLAEQIMVNCKNGTFPHVVPALAQCEFHLSIL